MRPQLTRLGKKVLIALLAAALIVLMVPVVKGHSYVYNYIYIFIAMPLLVTGIVDTLFNLIDDK